MLRKLVFLVFGVGICMSPAHGRGGQIANAAVAEANLRDFDFMVEKIRENYAGYETKTAGAHKAELEALTQTLRAKARTASLTELNSLMQQWVAFFRDEHTKINPVGSAPTTSPQGSPPIYDRSRVKMSEESALQVLTALGNQRDPAEGVWSIDGTRYRMAVLRTKHRSGQYSATVLSSTVDGWAPGIVKGLISKRPNGSYGVRYVTGDFGIVSLEGTMEAGGAVFDIGEYGAWHREWPKVEDEQAVNRRFPSNELFLRRLSPKTMWLRIPDFNDDRAAPLAAIMKEHASELSATDNLLIDLRRNGGGSDYVYAPLIPYLYTRPIYSIGIELRASRDNIALRSAIADKLRNSSEAAVEVAELVAQNKLMAANLGHFVQPEPLPFSITRLTSIFPYPKRIAIIVDGAGSTGEQFLLDARQSHKVTLFGQTNSAGVLDFANQVSMTSPSGRFELRWAISRSLRLPQDPVDSGGIAPDIRIPEAETDPVTFALKWLERQVD